MLAIRAAIIALSTIPLLAACGSDSIAALPPGTSSGTPSGPTLPVPATLWSPPAGSTPLQGSYLYVDMDTGFTPGVTYPHTIVASPLNFSVSVVRGTLTVSASDSTAPLVVRGVFTTMLGHDQLDDGYYDELRGAADANPLRGSLDVTLNTRACTSVTGWFVVDHSFYFNGRLTALDLRFEQRCPGFTAPMHGKLHW
ncbi:MAG TPA: hypothetical protein VGP25_11925, partial [Gemmatimonadaceae bacterium]|nr:hypothetical protein [Gemmatimonadaceae bacterium]